MKTQSWNSIFLFGMRAKSLVAVLCVFTLVTAATATINPIGPFTGMLSEGFEDHEHDFYAQIEVFDSEAIVRAMDGGQGVLVSYLWTYYGDVYPHSGSKFMGGASEPVEWVFDTPALRFGGFFTTNSDTSDALAKFYDENDNLLDELNVTAPADNSWAWNGWETDSDSIKRVQIIGYDDVGGFIMHDDMEYTPIPEPATVLLLGLGGLALLRKRRG